MQRALKMTREVDNRRPQSARFVVALVTVITTPQRAHWWTTWCAVSEVCMATWQTGHGLGGSGLRGGCINATDNNSILSPQLRMFTDVRYGSKANMCGANRYVRFSPESDRESRHPQRVMSALPLKADMCGATSDVC